MGTSLTKQEKLEQFDRNFLEDLANGISLSTGYYKEEKTRLLSILCSKLKLDEIEAVENLNSSGFDVKYIVDELKPASMYKIEEAVEKLLGGNNYLHEIKIGKRTCDIIYFQNGNIIGVEVKSATDNIERAREQLEYYKQWANMIYLAYDKKHREKASNLPLTASGLIEYLDGKAYFIKKAPYRDVDPLNLLLFMSSEYIRKIAAQYKVNYRGRKEDLARRLIKELKSQTIKKLFQRNLEIKSCLF